MIELVITLDPNTGVQVRGPLQDMILCYGLLEMAKDAIRRNAEKAAESRIVSAPPGLKVV